MNPACAMCIAVTLRDPIEEISSRQQYLQRALDCKDAWWPANAHRKLDEAVFAGFHAQRR